MTDASLAALWAGIDTQLRAQLRDGYGHLDAAAAEALETFDDRIAKVKGPLAETLGRCRDAAARNVELAKAQQQFVMTQLGRVDAAARASPDMSPTAWPAMVEIAGAVKMTYEALCLCWLLSAMLGHREATAFVEGAKQELFGAVGDPGTGMLTLLRRAHAVAARRLRKDQDAAELLGSLAAFEDLMARWNAVAREMHDGARFDAALATAFQGIDAT